MKRIVIYAYNEEMEALKPLAAQLEKQGAAARFMNIKYDEPTKCDIALAEEKHLERVKKIFKDLPHVEVKLAEANFEKQIKDAHKGTTPRQGDSQKTAEAVEPTKTDDVVPPLVNPAPGHDVTTLTPRKPAPAKK